MRLPYGGRMRKGWQIAWIVLALAIASACSSTPTSPDSTSTYAALGASDAVGIGASPVSEGYVYLLSRRLSAPRHGTNLHNFGVLGAQADQIAGAPLEQAIAVDPDVVTLWTGSND